MGEELKELYQAYREIRKDKKVSNIESSLAWLRREGIEYKVLNGANYHTLVRGKIDFWPSTGKWKIRGGRYGRGVRNLLREMKNGTR